MTASSAPCLSLSPSAGQGSRVKLRHRSVDKAALRAIRRSAIEFEASDLGCDGNLDVKEFSHLVRSRTGKKELDHATLLSWFNAINLRGSDVLTIDEFFRFSVFEVSLEFKGGLSTIFELFDLAHTGMLSEDLLSEALDEMGFEAVTSGLMRDFDPSGTGEVNYVDLLASLMRERDGAEQLALVRELSRKDEHSYRDIVLGQAAKRVAEAGSGLVQAQLETLLRSHPTQVMGMLTSLGTQSSGMVGERELGRVLRELGFKGSKLAVGELFLTLDRHRNNFLGLKELQAWLNEEPSKRRIPLHIREAPKVVKKAPGLDGITPLAYPFSEATRPPPPPPKVTSAASIVRTNTAPQLVHSGSAARSKEESLKSSYSWEDEQKEAEKPKSPAEKRREHKNRLHQPRLHQTSTLSTRLRDRLTKVQAQAQALSLPLAGEVTEAEEEASKGQVVLCERDTQIQIERVIEQRLAAMREIVAKQARVHNVERIRAESKLKEARELNVRLEALEAEQDGIDLAMFSSSSSAARRLHELQGVFGRADEKMQQAVHDTETLHMMTKRLHVTKDVCEDRVKRIEAQCAEVRAEHDKVTQHYRALSVAERAARQSLERAEAFLWSKQQQHAAQLKMRMDVKARIDRAASTEERPFAVEAALEEEALRARRAEQSKEWWALERYQGLEHKFEKFLISAAAEEATPGEAATRAPAEADVGGAVEEAGAASKANVRSDEEGMKAEADGGVATAGLSSATDRAMGLDATAAAAAAGSPTAGDVAPMDGAAPKGMALADTVAGEGAAAGAAAAAVGPLRRQPTACLTRPSSLKSVGRQRSSKSISAPSPSSPQLMTAATIPREIARLVHCPFGRFMHQIYVKTGITDSKHVLQRMVRGLGIEHTTRAALPLANFPPAPPTPCLAPPRLDAPSRTSRTGKTPCSPCESSRIWCSGSTRRCSMSCAR